MPESSPSAARGLLYHRVPVPFLGDRLYPLNQLKDVYPEAYFRHSGKYRGREGLMSARIHLLDCLWNDVLHFSPVHPRLIREALRAAGHSWECSNWFVIDPLACGLTAQNSVLFLHETPWEGTTPPARDFRPFSAAEVVALGAELPEATIRYYSDGPHGPRGPLPFAYVPHVLYRGQIETSVLETITEA